MRSFLNVLLATALSASAPALAAPPAGGAGSAEDWPRWRGPRGDGISRETLPDRWPAGGPKPVWKMMAGLGFASPIAHKGKVYLFSLDGSKEGLVAHDAETGKVVWAQAYDVAGKVDYDGTRATPFIDGDRIYTHGSRGLLVCRNLADGKELWRLDVPKTAGGSLQTWGQASAPLVTDKHVYVQAGSGGSIAVAVDKATGKLAWQSQATGIASYAQPVIAEISGGGQQLIVLAGKAVFGMDPQSGKTFWSQKWETSYDVNAATPVVRDDHLFISSAYGHGSMMLKLTATEATKLWEKRDIMCKFQPPILDGDLLYANSDEGRGTVKAMRWPSGQIAWEAKEPRLGSGGSIVRAGDKLLCMSESGMLSLLQTGPAGVAGIGQTQLFPENFKQVWSTPLLYGGKVYAKGEKELVCIDLGGK